jgi:cell division protein FtsQ
VAGGRARNRSRPRSRAATAVVPFPRGVSGDRLELSRLAPSGRSLLTALLLLLTALGLYAGARTTTVLAIDAIEVEGATPEVAAQVREALAPALGEPLVGLDVADLEHRARAVPMVAHASFDRAFPHTLSVTVVPEVPVAVLRQGAASWLVAAGGRVVGEVARGARPALPRIWLTRDVDVRVGEHVEGRVLTAAAAVSPLVRAPLPARVASVRATGEELTLVLRSGVELRLGDRGDLALKLEVARQVLPQLAPEDRYLDVSVPERPVAGTTLDSHVEVETSTSTTTSGSD